MEKFDVDNLLEDIELSCKELLTKNRFKLHLFIFSKFENAEECFYKTEENEDFINMVEWVAKVYKKEPMRVYSDIVEVKYPQDGEFFIDAADRFVAALSIYDIENRKD